MSEAKMIVGDGDLNYDLKDSLTDALKEVLAKHFPPEKAKGLERRYANKVACEFLSYFDEGAKYAKSGCTLAELAAEEDGEDPDALFDNDFLNKGGTGMLMAPSGVGKSVVAVQMAYSWALGRSAFGIRPKKPLKIAIFGTEDDRRTIKKFIRNMERGYKELCGWTDEEVKIATQNINVYFDDLEYDQEFLKQLVGVQRAKIESDKEPFDLIIINPLNGFTDVDIANNHELKRFTRFGLDRFAKGKLEGMPLKTALFIIHHTVKPPQMQFRGSFGKDQYAQYVGAGGHDLMGWTRFSLTLVPDTKVRDRFWLVAGKGGGMLNWKTPEKAGTLPMKVIKHQPKGEDEKEFLFWSEEPWSNVYPDYVETKGANDAESYAKILADKVKERPMTKTELRVLARGSVKDRAFAEKVLDHFYKHYRDYGLEEISQNGSGRGKMYCDVSEFEVLSAQNERNLLNFGVK